MLVKYWHNNGITASSHNKNFANILHIEYRCVIFLTSGILIEAASDDDVQRFREECLHIIKRKVMLQEQNEPVKTAFGKERIGGFEQYPLEKVPLSELRMGLHESKV